MRYNEPDEDEIEQEQQPRYVSDNTSFMRWSTEVEQKSGVIDAEFLKRNKERIMDIDKFLPLSNITSAKAIKLFHLRRQCITMAKDAGLNDLAEETALDNIADYNTTRGTKGFYQKALITQRREWSDSEEEKKRTGILKNLIRGKRDEQRANELYDGEQM